MISVERYVISAAWCDIRSYHVLCVCDVCWRATISAASCFITAAGCVSFRACNIECSVECVKSAAEYVII